MNTEKNLAAIQQASLDKEEENYHFKEFLQQRDSTEVDLMVHGLNNVITAEIDCTACGNCCKSLMINVTKQETKSVSDYLQINEEDFKEKYIETSLMGDMIVNKVPCHFLTGTICSIYEHRFAECREFPGLHKNGFTQRLFATFMHYGRCPIVYNVIEQLKIKTGFIK